MSSLSTNEKLPVEVLEQIFAHLHVSELYRCQVVCQVWRKAARNDSLLRLMCWKEGYLPWGQHLDQLLAPQRTTGCSDGSKYSAYCLSGRDEKHASTLEHLLKTSHLLRTIKSPPPLQNLNIGPSRPNLTGVVRCCFSSWDEQRISNIGPFHVDPVDNVIIAINSYGELDVIDQDSGAVLWKDAEARASSHLDFSEGWVVHDSRDEDGVGVYLQLRKFDRLDPQQSQPRRGILLPAASIRCPDTPSAVRLVWPHLVFFAHANIFIYDVSTLKLVELIPFSSRRRDNWRVHYISFDEDFVFLLALHTGVLDDSGLHVLDRKNKGKSVYRPTRCSLHYATGWQVDGHGMGELCFDGRPIKDCPVNGITTELIPSNGHGGDRYVKTNRCCAVHPDPKTGSLCLSGAGALVVIPEYKDVFRRLRGRDKMGIPLREIQVVGVGEAAKAGTMTDLAVADGVAAFVSSAHSLPVWIDLAALIRWRPMTPKPRINTFYPGDPILCDATGLAFYGAGGIRLNAAQLYVALRLLRPHAPDGWSDTPSCGVLKIDFGAIVQDQLAFADRSFYDEPPGTTILFLMPTTAQQREPGLLQHLSQGSTRELVFPNGTRRTRSEWLRENSSPRLDEERIGG